MEQVQQPMPYQDDEITLKELILKIQEFWREIWKNFWIVALSGILMGSAFLVQKIFLTKRKYTAEYKFMLEVEDLKGGGLAGVAASFGYNVGGLGAVNLDKMVELAKSRALVAKALLQEEEINGRQDKLINHHIEIYEMLKDFESKEELKNFSHFTSTRMDDFSEQEVRAFYMIYKHIAEEVITASADVKKLQIVTLSVTSISAEYSYHFANHLYNAVHQFYIRKSVEPQQKSVDVLQHRADSIFSLLRGAEYRGARFQDTERGAFLATDKLEGVRSARDQQMLSLIYAELVKNLELARFSLETKRPVLQIIDRPFLPLEKQPRGAAKAAIIGGFLGGFLSVGFVLGRKIFREAMAS